MVAAGRPHVLTVLPLFKNACPVFKGSVIAYGQIRPIILHGIGFLMQRKFRRCGAPWLFSLAFILTLARVASAQDVTLITVLPAKVRQEFSGLGAGAIFYEGHITSLAERKKDERQEQLYDDMFLRVPTDFLQLMIREIHEPENDNADPYKPAFDEKNFEYCRHTLHLAKAALKRRPKMQFLATLYTPPPWMKTNGEASGGGEARATVKEGLELELAEYAWAFLAHMQKNGVRVQYLSIANEPDWPHTQPGYCLTAERYATLLRTVGEYLDKMARLFPDIPRVKLVSPNTLSAPGATKDYVPLAMRVAGRYLDVVGTHDYDQRGDRWGDLRRMAGKRPLWLTEWCPRDKDASPGMIDSALKYGVAMHEAFQGGANVWMAYDWVYPPRDSGEALIHVEWGNDYRLTKPYYLFRQWAEPLEAGMHLVETNLVARKGADPKTSVKPTAFLAADGETLVVHVVNSEDKSASIAVKPMGKFTSATSAQRTRTSAKEDAEKLPALDKKAASFADTVPGKSMVTYRFGLGDKSR